MPYAFGVQYAVSLLWSKLNSTEHRTDCKLFETVSSSRLQLLLQYNVSDLGH